MGGPLLPSSAYWGTLLHSQWGYTPTLLVGVHSYTTSGGHSYTPSGGHSYTPTLLVGDTPTLPVGDTPTLLHSQWGTLLHDQWGTLLHSYTPSGVHSCTPRGVHSYTPKGVHSYTPSRVHSYTPPSRGTLLHSQQGGSAWGVPCSPLPSKFCPLLPAPQAIFITAPQINFTCSLNHLCSLPAPCNFFNLLPESMECTFYISGRDGAQNPWFTTGSNA